MTETPPPGPGPPQHGGPAPSSLPRPSPGPAVRGVVVLVRHGETEWSAARKHTGRTDVPLTARGESEAAALATLVGKVLAGRRVVLALTSPRQRATRTAELAGIDAEVEPALAEIDYGEYEGLTTAAIRAGAPEWTVWTGGLPGGESFDDVSARVDALVARVREALAAADADDPPAAAVLVGHGHLLRALAARWIGLPASAGALFPLDTAAVGVLGREHETPALLHWNIPADNLLP
jgi:broad specificity phosphatase PhoE